MENKLAKLYNELANTIISMIPTEFEEVYFMGEVEPRKSTVLFYFKNKNNNKFIQSYLIPQIYNVSEEIYEELEQKLYEITNKINYIFIEHEQEPWSVLDLYFNNQGKFNIDFSYDEIDDEKCNHATRCIVWAYKRIGITYKEGSYSYEILEEYLKENS